MDTVTQRDREDTPTWKSSDGETSASREALIKGFQTLLADAEDLLKATADYSAEGYARAREKFQGKLSEARVKLSDAQGRVSQKAHQAADLTEQYVADNPWKALAIVGFAGIVVGLLMSRR